MKKRMMCIAGAMLLSGVMAQANITTMANGSTLSGPNSKTNTYSGASVGDYFVVLLAPNKREQLVDYTSVIGSASTAGLQLVSFLQAAANVNHTTWGWVYSVTNAGNIQSVVSANGNNTTYIGDFLLHSANGTLALGDTSVLSMDGETGPEYWTNSYSWAAADDAVVMETMAGNVETFDWDKTTILRANSSTNQAVQYKEGLGSLAAYEDDFYTDTGTRWKDATTLGVVITETIPEPATLGMLGLVGGAIFFIRRRFMI